MSSTLSPETRGSANSATAAATSLTVSARTRWRSQAFRRPSSSRLHHEDGARGIADDGLRDASAEKRRHTGDDVHAGCRRGPWRQVPRHVGGPRHRSRSVPARGAARESGGCLPLDHSPAQQQSAAQSTFLTASPVPQRPRVTSSVRDARTATRDGRRAPKITIAAGHGPPTASRFPHERTVMRVIPSLRRHYVGAAARCAPPCVASSWQVSVRQNQGGQS